MPEIINFSFLNVKKMYSDNEYIIYEDNEGFLWIHKNLPSVSMEFRRFAINEGVMTVEESFITLYNKLGIEINGNSLLPLGVVTVLNGFDNPEIKLVKCIDLLTYNVIDIKDINNQIKYLVKLVTDENNVPYVESIEEQKW